MARQSTTGKLPDTTVRTAKPKDKPYKLSDGGGLFLLVKPTGAKYWRLKYRLHGKEKTLAIGVYPDVKLTEARKEATKAKNLVREGQDPVIARKLEKETQAASTFELVAREWFEQQKGKWVASHAERVLESLEAEAFPRIGDMPIQNIKTLDCLAVVRAIEGRGALDVAGRVKQRMSAVFRYAIHTARLEANPVDQLKGIIATRKVSHRASIKPEALPAFLRAVEGYQGHLLTKLGLKLLMLTFVRPGELRGARWSEFDLAAKQWRIPAERMKMKEEHIVPLSEQALAVLEELSLLSGRLDLVFPSQRNVRQPMSENTLTFAIRRRLGFDATAHGMRSTASTILNETGFKADVIERQLAHAERNKVRAAYHHSQYLAERTEMMQWWADYLGDQREHGTVVPIRKQA